LFDLGVVSEIVPVDRVRSRALEFSQAMLANSWDAIRNGKLLHDMAADMSIDQAMILGGAFGDATLASADSREGIAAFANRPTKS
jgi:enoyl-CoA hydratase/carnithine racemase